MSVLTEDEIRFFKREGYLVKKGALDPELCARARERLWDDPPPSLKKDDPDSWVGPIKPEEESMDKSNYKRGYRWQYRKVGREPWMVELLAKNPVVWGAAEQMLGKGNFPEPRGVRGIYCTLPYGDVERQPRHLHVDAHAFNFAVVGYIDHVPEDGGGFTVWPKSHRTFFFDYQTRYLKEPLPRIEAHREAFQSCDENSYQTHGEPGDIVFWHHRIGHMASANYSRQIRKAVLYDFKLNDMPQLQEEPPGDDIWVDWTDDVRDVSIEDGE